MNVVNETHNLQSVFLGMDTVLGKEAETISTREHQKEEDIHPSDEVIQHKILTFEKALK